MQGDFFFYKLLWSKILCKTINLLSDTFCYQDREEHLLYQGIRLITFVLVKFK